MHLDGGQQKNGNDKSPFFVLELLRIYPVQSTLKPLAQTPPNGYGKRENASCQTHVFRLRVITNQQALKT